jgi:hypothetical protein
VWRTFLEKCETLSSNPNTTTKRPKICFVFIFLLFTAIFLQPLIFNLSIYVFYISGFLTTA